MKNRVGKVDEKQTLNSHMLDDEVQSLSSVSEEEPWKVLEQVRQ